LSLNKEKINELAQKVQNWDTESFWEIYDILIQNIYSFIFYKVSHKETAEDLSEEVFVKVWDKIWDFKFQDSTPFTAWVYKIASNIVIDYYRKNSNFKIQSIHKEEWEDYEFEDFKSHDSVKQDAKNSFDKKFLKKWLDKIWWTEKDVILFKYLNDLEYSEIAIITGKSEENVRKIHSRWIKKLKDILEEFN